MSSLPLTPPTPEHPKPPVGEAVLGGLQEKSAAEAEQLGLRERLVNSKAGRLVGALALTGTLVFIGSQLGGCENNQKANETSASANGGNASPSSKKSEICPNGIFDPKNPMELTSKVRPGDLHQRPDKPTSEDKDFSKYMFGEKGGQKGVTCALPTDLAVYEKAFDSWVGGEGKSGKPFGDLLGGANELAAFYASNPDAAEKAVKGEGFVSFVKALKNNEQVINAGTYFELVLVNGVITQVPTDLPEMKKGEVRTIGKSVWVYDSEFTGNGQMVIQFNSDGKLYILKSLGDAPVASTTTSTTTSTPEGSSQGSQGNNSGDTGTKSGKRGNANGGGGNTGNNQGNGGTGGSAGPNGNNPEAGPGGVTSSPGEGSTATTTRPAPTTTAPRTTTTRPAPTTTAPRTTTTRPAPTTTAPKGTEITIPGAPN